MSDDRFRRIPVDPGPLAQADRPDVPVIDYEGSGYRADFWANQGREYEDAVEREVLRRLLPQSGGRIAEIGAGFGRLANLYQGFQQVVLVDYSRTLLAEARERWGADGRFVFVAGNLYQLPLATASLDVLIMVRVMHHLADVPGALAQIRRALHQNSVAVLEYANKRNLKAILRWLFRRQPWSPFDREPVEFVTLNFDFHPAWMAEHQCVAGLRQRKRLAVSHFRLPLLKRQFSPDWLVSVERPLFTIGGRFPLSPSVFTLVDAPQARPRVQIEPLYQPLEQLFRCPGCGTDGLDMTSPDLLVCPDCRTRYACRGGIWDFKQPVM